MLNFFAGAFAFGLIEWVLIAVIAIALVTSIVSYAAESFGFSFTALVVIYAALGFINKGPLLDYVHAGSMVKAIAYPVGIYLAVGVLVSLVNWIFYVMHVKTRYRNFVLPYLTDSVKFASYKQTVIEAQNAGNTPIDPALFTDDIVRKILQLDMASQNRLEIFGRSYGARIEFKLGYLKQYGTIAEIEKMVTTIMLENFPPKTLKGKAILASAIFEWPITILSLVFSRILTVLADWLIFTSRKFIDWVSSITFGSHEIKL
jgi:hypothetical protein